MQDDLLVVSRGQLIGGANRVEVLRGGPAGPVLGAVLVELHGVEHRDDRKIIAMMLARPWMACFCVAGSEVEAYWSSS